MTSKVGIPGINFIAERKIKVGFIGCSYKAVVNRHPAVESWESFHVSPKWIIIIITIANLCERLKIFLIVTAMLILIISIETHDGMLFGPVILNDKNYHAFNKKVSFSIIFK